MSTQTTQQSVRQSVNLAKEHSSLSLQESLTALQKAVDISSQEKKEPGEIVNLVCTIEYFVYLSS